MADRTYFANLGPSEIAGELHQRAQVYYEEIERNGRLSLWRKCRRKYYALDSAGNHVASEIGVSGEQGELSTMTANHYRNLLQHLHVLVTQQKPAFEARAINTDYRSQTQTILARNILEYYLKEKRLIEHFRRIAEYSIVYAEGFMTVEYDASKGDIGAVDPDTDEGIPHGDVVCRVYTPIDVVRQLRGDVDTQSNWHIIRRYENRYDLMARYPEHADKLLDIAEGESITPFGTLQDEWQATEEDLIPVYQFFHDRTPACPNGREILYVGDDLVLEYSDLTYPTYPVFRMAAYNMDGTSLGYSVSFDLLVVQEAVDMLYSTILSNQAAFGVQNIWLKPGSTIQPTELAGGLNVIQSMEKPEPINLTNTPPEIFNFLQGLEGLGQTLSGINSVARGNPEASLKSGQALALVAAQAVQFANGIQSSYSQTLEDVGTAVLKTLQTKAHIPRLAAIAGKDNRSFLKEFSGKDIDAINRVVVELGNPVSQTLAGRQNLADQLLQQQMFKTPSEYIQVVTTGRIDSATNKDMVTQFLIQKENEEMREGRSVPVVAIDQHVEHLNGHAELLADPSARRDPALVQTVLAHLEAHIQALSTTNPNLLNALGQAPLGPTPQQMGAAAPQPNAAPQQGPGQPPAAPPSPLPPNSPEILQQNQPSLPPETPPEMIPGA